MAKLSEFGVADATALEADSPTSRLSDVALPPEQDIDPRLMARAREAYKGDELGGAIYQGLTLGFGDEIDGALAAAAQQVVNLARRATGRDPEYTAGDVYSAFVKAAREKQERFHAQHPAGAAAANIAGGLLTPGLKAAGSVIGAAPTVAGKIARSAALGGGLGAAAGAGNAEGGIIDRLPETAIGAMLGAGTGGLVEGGISALGSGSRVATGALERAKTALGGEVVPTPKQISAAQQQARDEAVRIARASGERGMPEALGANAAEESGRQITAAEALGRTGQTMLSMLARRMGKTPDALESQLLERQGGMTSRLMEDVQAATGLAPEAIFGDFAAHTKALRAKAAPLYEEAYAVGPLNSERLQTLLGRPSMQKALSRASEIAAEEGRDPQALGFANREAPVIVDGVALKRPDGSPITFTQAIEVRTPTAQTWDYIKRGLDDVVEDYRDKTTGKLRLDERGRATLNTLNELRGELMELNPRYAEALNAGGEPLRLEDAFRKAPELMSNAPLSVFKRQIESFSPAQLEAVKAGWMNDLFEKAAKDGTRLKMLNTPAFHGKLRMLFGDEQAAKILRTIDFELQLAKGMRMIPGSGSDTMTLTQAAKDADRDMSGFMGGLRKVFSGNLGGGLMQVLGSPVQAAITMSRTPADIASRDALGEILRGPPSALAQVLREEAARAPVTAPMSSIARAAPAPTVAATATRPRPGAVVIEGPDGALYDRNGMLSPEAAQEWRAERLRLSDVAPAAR